MWIIGGSGWLFKKKTLPVTFTLLPKYFIAVSKIGLSQAHVFRRFDC
jgi:hypothetical protein